MSTMRGVRVEGAIRRYIFGVINGIVIFGVAGYGFAYMLGYVGGEESNVASRVCERYQAGASYESAMAYARDVVHQPSRIEPNRDGFRIVADFPDPSRRPICVVTASRGEVTGTRYYRGRTY